MLSNYELKLDKFKGPLEKLLELIEERKMEVNEISLAAVTEDFLNYLKGLERIEVPFLADFIVIASRLVLLKSKSLLVQDDLVEEEEEGIKDLERRLKIYKELKPLIKTLGELWRKSNWEFARSYFLEGGLGSYWANSGMTAQVFFPGEKLEVNSLKAALDNLLQGLGSIKVETRVIREKVVSLEEKIREIINRLEAGVKNSFGKISEAKARSEVVVIFLAILHLAHEKLIKLEQVDNFSDIIIEKT